MITIQEENVLIDKILMGDQRLYAQLVDRYKSYAFTIALKITESRPDAEEVAQDAFIKAYQYLKSFKRDAKFSTWLYRIVFNTAISHKRKKKHAFQPIEKSVEHGENDKINMESEDKVAFINEALQKMNEADRLSIQLFYLKEFSMEEVAEIMGQKLNTIKVRIHRARLRLAEELKIILKDEALTL